MSRFEIFKSMRAGVPKPYRIHETTLSVDGPRTRIVDGTWATWREAAEYLRPFDASVFASHELTVYYPDKGRILAREEFYGSDIEAQRRLTAMWNEKTPANGTGFTATARRYGEPKPFDTIG